MDHRKMTNWMSLDWLLDHFEQQGAIFKDWEGNTTSPREAIHLFARWCLSSGMEFTEDDDLKLYARFERTEVGANGH